MKHIIWGVLFMIMGCMKPEQTAKAVMYLATDEAKQNPIGEVVFIDTPDGLQINIDLKNLPAGAHGFHIHEHPDCGSKTDEHGQVAHAMMAGGHYDPDHTGKHLGPDGGGHRGDLPVLYVQKDGTAKAHMLVRSLTASEIKNHSLMIHAGGDNYKDEPVPLGGGGARIACGVIR